MCLLLQSMKKNHFNRLESKLSPAFLSKCENFSRKTISFFGVWKISEGQKVNKLPKQKNLQPSWLHYRWALKTAWRATGQRILHENNDTFAFIFLAISHLSVTAFKMANKATTAFSKDPV